MPGRRREPSVVYSYYSDCEDDLYSYYSVSPTPRPRRRDRDRGSRRQRGRSRSRGRRDRGGRGGGRDRGRSRDQRGSRGAPPRVPDRRPIPVRDAPRSPSKDGDPSNAEIWNMLIDREKARIARDFKEADKIRDELRDLGIEIYDRERKWEAKDGRVGLRPNKDEKRKESERD
eukprot:TRINITY_DN20232_c0_g1_i2.p1 TRINITY_DN20232_c0_g1~~TRINITY_DN20232_c0_g1_i2.p1  ORF type:complete len:173 (+),score=14.79 TRINITY_DN20232_c0_g1_i2:44-562(+)